MLMFWYCFRDSFYLLMPKQNQGLRSEILLSHSAEHTGLELSLYRLGQGRLAAPSIYPCQY